jgi:hypothetical protein
VVVQAHNLKIRDDEVLKLTEARLEHFRNSRQENQG